MSIRTIVTGVLLAVTLLIVGCSSGLGESDVNATADAAVDKALAAIPPTNTPRPSDTPVIVTVVQTAISTEIIEVTREIEITREVEVTRVVDRPVTVTPTNTPENSPTPSNTPTITPTPTNTPTPTQTPTPTATPNLAQTATMEAYGALAAPKQSGFYVVGSDILPGKWHSTGTGVGCYWVRKDSNGELIDNHFGAAGGTVNIKSTDFEVEFNDCGVWEYVENMERVLQSDAAEPKEDGFYTVGVEIAIGRWKSTGTDDGCYWVRLDGSQDILDNHYGQSGGTMIIRETDYEVAFNDCGTWEYQGP